MDWYWPLGLITLYFTGHSWLYTTVANHYHFLALSQPCNLWHITKRTCSTTRGERWNWGNLHVVSVNNLWKYQKQFMYDSHLLQIGVALQNHAVAHWETFDIYKHLVYWESNLCSSAYYPCLVRIMCHWWFFIIWFSFKNNSVHTNYTICVYHCIEEIRYMFLTLAMTSQYIGDKVNKSSSPDPRKILFPGVSCDHVTSWILLFSR